MVVLFLVSVLVLGFYDAPFFLWGAWALILERIFHFPVFWSWVTIFVVGVGMIPTIRSILMTFPLMAGLGKMKVMPSLSRSEKQAIEAGESWVEKEFFSGKPDLRILMKQPLPQLTEEEQRFLSQQVETLCDRIDDWKIWRDRDVPAEIMDFIKKERLLGLIIPKQYGGLGFSAAAHSEMIRKIASRSFVVAIYVMVPNSLGPAELLVHYGTDEQKKRLLPKLATGAEIPCFALTETAAGSDASSIKAEGILFKKDGTLWLRFNWDKRYITLAGISTLLGVAFRLKDPENFLGKGEDVGVTCALVPSRTPGIHLEKRHDPLGVPFYNSPIHARNVEVPANSIVGGIERAGEGWIMLMECLAAGRGISFPAQMAGASQLVTHLVSAYALVRHQFGVPIGRFEGIQEPLARILGTTYLIEALRQYTLCGLQQGIKPGVVSALSKYYSTENYRRVVNDAMDIMGGAAISQGPRNVISHYFFASPIGITVEGANILTRSLMIFGQGVYRAHPFAYLEMRALESGDLKGFDRALWAHVGNFWSNGIRSFMLSLTRGWLAEPFDRSQEAKYLRRISWASASFSCMVDLSMVTLGGRLKVKESLTGHLSDIVSYLYISSGILRKFKADGRKAQDWPLAEYSLEFSFHQIQIAFDQIFQDFRVPFLSWFFRGPVAVWSRCNSMGQPHKGHLISEVANIALNDSHTLDHLTSGIYLPKDPEEHLFLLREAADLYRQVEPVEKRIAHDLGLDKKTKRSEMEKRLPSFVEDKMITPEEATLLKNWYALRLDVVEVDELTEAEYHGKSESVMKLFTPELKAG